MKLKKLPIGKSTFRTIVEEDFLYVDKTHITQDLIENGGGYYFLSRPRRFGKSLFLDTLRMAFSGDKELFNGLHIYSSGYEFTKHPVIRVSLNDGDFKTKDEFRKTIIRILKENQVELGLECEEKESASACFRELIIKAYKKYNKKVVILVDEYDKPILDNIEDTEIAQSMREELKNFYSVIKGADEYLKFVFITGVSKFSKVSLFSGLNNIEDITLNPRYATICGYTQNDVETVFAEHLKGQDFAKIQKWYNGYKFLGEGVYNPFDILLFISNQFTYRNYWFSTATPTFLLKIIEKNNYFLPNLENIVKDEKMLDSFDVDYIELETLMWQTGYLTISHTETILDIIEYHLKIPNKEVTQSLLGSIADFISKNQNSTAATNGMLRALLKQDLLEFKNKIHALFSGIAYNNFTGVKLYEYEGYYVSVFYAYIKALGIELIAEDVTSKGRIDMTIKLPETIYVIEFKVNTHSDTNALQQIKERNYHDKYLSDGRDVVLIGIEFDGKERNISKLEFEKV
jgi:hypothetical protein